MISFEQVSLHFGERRLFDDISFFVGPRDRIGLVGKNGAGKSTLLKAITGLAGIDSGRIVTSTDTTFGYLPQELKLKDGRNVLEEAMTAFRDLHRLEKEIDHLNKELERRTDYETDSYLELAERIAEKSERLGLLNAASAEANAVKTLKGLGFNEKDLQRPTKKFSGGWRMRIELAKILLQSPDIFLLDEPTNHLDIESIQWLENFLKQYHGAVILISHDRAFLDNITTRTAEIALGRITDYKVPYSRYVELRKERREQLMAAYQNQQKQIEDTKEFIERFRYKATKAVQVQSRIKQLEKMDVIEIEEEDSSAINLRFPQAPRAGDVVFEARGLTKAYGNHIVLEDIDLTIERGEKIAFVGRNGEGKTTLSRIIAGDLTASGRIKNGHNVKLGYYAQNQDELLNPEASVLETIDRVAVGEVRTRMRDILGAFLFRGEDVDKKVRVLSGGEKSRLALARLLLEPYNLLVLDEPTNHLDIRSKDILKQALRQYDGTVVLVSHDREFLNGLTDKIFEFRNRKIKEFRGDIYEFLKQKQIDSLDLLGHRQVSKQNNEPDKQDQIAQKEFYLKRKELDREIRNAESRLEKIEEEIEASEASLAEIEQRLAGKDQNEEMFGEYQQQKEKIDKLLPEWESLQNMIESLRKKRNSLN